MIVLWLIRKSANVSSVSLGASIEKCKSQCRGGGKERTLEGEKAA